MTMMSYFVLRCSQGVDNIAIPSSDSEHFPEIIVQKPATRIVALARGGERLQAVAQRLLRLCGRDAIGLIEQRNASLIARKLVVGSQELVPTRIRGGHRVDGHHVAVVRI